MTHCSKLRTPALASVIDRSAIEVEAWVTKVRIAAIAKISEIGGAGARHEVPHPRLVRQRPDALLQHRQAEEDEPDAEHGEEEGTRRGGAVDGEGQAGDAEDHKHEQMDVERGDDDDDGGADIGADQDGEAAFHREQAAAEHADDDEGDRRGALHHRAGGETPQDSRPEALGPRRHSPAEPAAGELLQVLGEEIHAGKEDADPTDATGNNRQHHAPIAAESWPTSVACGVILTTFR